MTKPTSRSATTAETTTLKSASPVDERLLDLAEIFPETVRDGILDPQALIALLGVRDGETSARRRFGLEWPGRADAVDLLRLPGLGTLLPQREQSVRFDDAEHVYVTGENLEVMKLLQKAYFGAFKMIYMDPPYNTGSDQIYNDDYTDPLLRYLKYSGQIGDDDKRLTSLVETDGRIHSRWLTMMLPRLFVARNLLADSGVLFASIDDHEVHHLRMLMDEVFGTENFVCSFVWEKRYGPAPDAADVGYVHENILCYRRSDSFKAALLPMTEMQKGRYKNRDNDKRGPWKAADYACRFTAKERPKQFYPIRKRSSGFPEIEIGATFDGNNKLALEVTQPGTKPRSLVLTIVSANGEKESQVIEVKKDTFKIELTLSGTPRAIGVAPDGPTLMQWPNSMRVWACSQTTHRTNDAEERIWWPPGSEVPSQKKFLSEIRQGAVPSTLLRHDDVGHTDEATKELRKWFPDIKITPKPTRLIRYLMHIAGVQRDDLVLDCFAGTGTTAEAVLDANEQEDIGAKFVLVQLPEPLKHGPRNTMAEIGRERAVMRAKTAPKDNPIGVRAFTLASSCFRSPSREVPKDGAAVAEQLKFLVDNVASGRGEEDLLFEVLLKAGFSLTTRAEIHTVAATPVYSVASGMLLVCLARTVSQAFLRGVVERAPQRLVCLDLAFQGNDQLKTNTVLEMRSHGIEFRTV